jgi:hypothetical protein
MYSAINDDVFRKFLESGIKEEEAENDKRALRKRCQNCSDRPYCDMDFCLHWYH